MKYQAMAEKVLAGGELSREEGLSILRAPDEDLPAVLEATFRVRQHWHGRRVKICVLLNAQSGLCPEDCAYCSQSKVSTADIPKYRLLPVEDMIDNARHAAKDGAKRFCMVISARGPSDRDIDHVTTAVRKIKDEYPHLEICCSLGLMTVEQGTRLKEAGVGWVNHNLNTSERFYPEICTTHTYRDRLQTVENIRKAGLNTCCGGIMGMGEDEEDLLELAFAVRDMDITSIPLNFLHPIEGTPMAGKRTLTPEQCLKALCLFRLVNPSKEIRAAGGRELHLQEHQGRVLYAANSIFVEGYLTTEGQAAEDAHRMIRELGFEPEPMERAAAGSSLH